MTKSPVNKYRTLNVWGLPLSLAMAVMFSPHAGDAGQGGPDISQFISKTTMTNTGVIADANGRIDETLTRKGRSNSQQLQISAVKLDPNAAYGLVAYIGGDTNAMSIAEFTTDKAGRFNVIFLKRIQGKPNAHREMLPDVLDPLCNVQELDIVDANTNTVLRGVLTSPDKGRYLVKRSMTSTTFFPAADGELMVQASHQNVTRFQLQARNLSPGTPYRLMINSNVAPAAMSDKAGRLILKTLPPGSPDVLDIQTVALTDGTGTNVILITGGLGIPCTTAGQAPSFLGAAANFAVLAGSTVANTGPTKIKGQLGLSPGSAVTGFPPGQSGNQHVADSTAAQAQLDLTTAYNDAAGRSVGAVSVSGNLGGLTLAPGLYKSTSSLEISSGDLTLDAQGDVNAVFIFQMASTLTTSAGRQVILSGGAKAANVYWQVGSSATLGTTTFFKGTIMANQSITLATGATLEGRALARIAAVTLDSNAITVPAP